MDELLPKTIGVITAYLVGSISFSLLAGYVARGVDLRTIGSGNLGATNVGRILGWPYGVAVYLLDFGKGVFASLVLPSVIASAFWLDWDLRRAGLYFGVVAVVGHMFPLYLKLRGGKGVATASGMLLVVLPGPTLIAMGLWALTLWLCRFMAVSSMVAALSLPFSIAVLERGTFWQEQREIFLVSIAISGLVILRHLANIRRLLEGTERPIGAEAVGSRSEKGGIG